MTAAPQRGIKIKPNGSERTNINAPLHRFSFSFLFKQDCERSFISAAAVKRAINYCAYYEVVVQLMYNIFYSRDLVCDVSVLIQGPQFLPTNQKIFNLQS